MTWALFGEQSKAVIEILQTSSDRVAAVVGGALLDSTLDRTLKERLRNDSDIAKKLLRVGGALGNTVPKSDLLYMLHAFEKPTLKALWGLSKIRNFFAHNLGASFDSKDRELADGLSLLKLHEGRKMYPHHLFSRDSKEAVEPTTSKRSLFLVNLKLCLLALMRDRVSHYTWTNQPLPVRKLREQLRTGRQPERPSRGKPQPPKTPR